MAYELLSQSRKLNKQAGRWGEGVLIRAVGFQHNFRECLDPCCMCSLEIESTSHYLLQCYHSTPFRTDLTNSVKTFVVEFESLSDG